MIRVTERDNFMRIWLNGPLELIFTTLEINISRNVSRDNKEPGRHGMAIFMKDAKAFQKPIVRVRQKVQ